MVTRHSLANENVCVISGQRHVRVAWGPLSPRSPCCCNLGSLPRYGAATPSYHIEDSLPGKSAGLSSKAWMNTKETFPFLSLRDLKNADSYSINELIPLIQKPEEKPEAPRGQGPWLFSVLPPLPKNTTNHYHIHMVVVVMDLDVERNFQLSKNLKSMSPCPKLRKSLEEEFSTNEN